MRFECKHSHFTAAGCLFLLLKTVGFPEAAVSDTTGSSPDVLSWLEAAASFAHWTTCSEPYQLAWSSHLSWATELQVVDALIHDLSHSLLYLSVSELLCWNILSSRHSGWGAKCQVIKVNRWPAEAPQKPWRTPDDVTSNSHDVYSTGSKMALLTVCLCLELHNDS